MQYEVTHMNNQIESICKTVNYIENNLNKKLNLEKIAHNLNYSKYHLHRLFKQAVGITIHDYVQRRQLSEAAKLLVFSHHSILDIALLSGYESQQAFSTIFKQFYKKTPLQYRENKEFYPLQLKYTLHPRNTQTNVNWEDQIRLANLYDIDAWMNLVDLVIDGFPNLQYDKYLKNLNHAIINNQALILIEKDIAIGAMIFNYEHNNIDFFGVHPQYRHQNTEQAFLNVIIQHIANDITITTFRKNDKADLGQRQTLKQLGFVEAELLYEFGYPTQRFILSKKEGYNCE